MFVGSFSDIKSPREWTKISTRTYGVKLGGLGPVELAGDHGGRLAIVGVNGLLADNDQVGLFLLDHLGEDF